MCQRIVYDLLRNEIKYMRCYAPLTLKLKNMMEGINKILIFLIVFFIFSCNSVKNTVYTVEMTLINGDLITRHYILEDSIKLFLKNRRGKSFLVYDKKDITRYPFKLKKNVVNFKTKL